MVDNVIVLAGGAGKRLWPASMGDRPKQFLKVDGRSTLFRLTLERAFDLGMAGEVLVVTHEDHVDAALEECRSFPVPQKGRIRIVAEPVARNTAPALTLASARLNLTGRGGQNCLVMAADHIISPRDEFRRSVETASRHAAGGVIVPFGIVPTEAATGYGYIEAGSLNDEAYQVLSFREKPDRETAAAYMNSGRHYWNAGLFTYRDDVFRNELAGCSPELAAVFDGEKDSWFESDILDGIHVDRPSGELRKIYASCPAISIDYAVMEKTEKILMVRADFQWNDVGSWDVIARVGRPPETPVLSFESNGNFVYSDRPVALCGVDDLIVVVANGRVLVCRKGSSQLVRDAAEADLNN